MTGWTARELSRQSGIPIATVLKWVDAGFITPEGGGVGRKGYTIGIQGLLEFVVVQNLVSVGFKFPAIREAFQNLRKLSGQERPFSKLNVVVSGKDILWKDTDDLSEVSALRQPGQALMIFPVSEQHEQLLQKLLSGEQTSASLMEAQI